MHANGASRWMRRQAATVTLQYKDSTHCHGLTCPQLLNGHWSFTSQLSQSIVHSLPQYTHIVHVCRQRQLKYICLRRAWIDGFTSPCLGWGQEVLPLRYGRYGNDPHSMEVRKTRVSAGTCILVVFFELTRHIVRANWTWRYIFTVG